MKRIYESVLREHFTQYDQMAFMCGARQIGKTTIAKSFQKEFYAFKYLNWDTLADRETLLQGEKKMVEGLALEASLPQRPVLVLDEIHKYPKWKNLLKGFIDSHKGQLNVLVTGSAKLNVFRRGGDSLMGRYFLYRVHPLSVAEILRTSVADSLYQSPQKIPEDAFENLCQFGGFPEPFTKSEKRFYNRWQALKRQQMLKEDVRELAQIQELAQLEVLAALLQHQAGQLVKYSNLANKVRVSDQTIRRWIQVLESFYYCFLIRPWSRNVARSLLKEPKVYLWDWSVVEEGAKQKENMVASHLLKAVHYWTDVGFGKFELYFLRDKSQREVDFLIVRDNKPWLMVEVKSSGKEPLSKSLYDFQVQLKAQHVLQVAFDLPYIDQDCFLFETPKIVPAKTFLSQLV